MARLITIQDLLDLYYHVRRASFISILRYFNLSPKGRVKAHWEQTKGPQKKWTYIPAVQRRINFLITGNPDKNYFEYIAEKYLRNLKSITGISIGSGRGNNELCWAGLCDFKRLEGIELSKKLVCAAAELAKKKRKKELIFRAVDVFKVKLRPQSYDVAFAQHSLHHFSPVESVIKQIYKALKKDGLFIVQEYVGPNRFQWTDKQLKEVNDLLANIPKKYRRRWNLKSLKRKIYRPGLIRIILSDPSEAIESENILPALKKYFEFIEFHEYGGTILNPLFQDIAINFSENDEEAMKHVKLCFDKEDKLIKSKEMSSDFVLVICKKKEVMSKLIK